MSIGIDDCDGCIVYLFGAQDHKVDWVLRRVLRVDDTALDIGADYGAVAVPMARAVGPTSCVNAFEPQPRLATMIEASVAINRFEQIAVHPVALSDSNRTATLHVNPGAAEKRRSKGPGKTAGSSSRPMFEMRRRSWPLRAPGF